MKVGFRILAEQLDDLVTDPRTNEGWHTVSLRSILRMDVDPPELVEDRVVTATTDQLEELEMRFSAPGAATNPITATIVYGGEIVREQRVATSHGRFVVRLPRPLRTGEHHEYGVRFSALTRTEMRPYYVLTPLQPCARFAVRVRFDLNAPPAKIWKVDGVPPRALDDFVPLADLLDVDRLGEVALAFSHLQQGLSYGVQWSGHLR